MYFLFLPYLYEWCKTCPKIFRSVTHVKQHTPESSLFFTRNAKHQNRTIAACSHDTPTNRRPKVLLHLAKVHLPEHKDNANGHNTNISINIGDVHSMYFVGIDLHDWHVDEVQKLKTLILEVEQRKQGTSATVVDSQ